MSREGGIGAIITLLFVGVGRGREGRERFGGGEEEEETGEDVPLTTAAIVSDIAKKSSIKRSSIE